MISRLRRQFAIVALLLGACGFGVAVPARAQAGPQQVGPGVSEKSTPINAVPEKREEEQDSNEKYRHSAAVVKLGSMMGMNAEQAATAFTALNFLILAAGVGFLGLKILPKAFRDRSSAIQKGLVEARSATEEAGARLRAVENRLAKLDDEIASMRRQVESDTLREEERIKQSVETETAKIVAAAESEIQSATAAARRELQRHAAELAIDHATRQLEITPDTDRLLIKGFAERLVSGKGVQN